MRLGVLHCYLGLGELYCVTFKLTFREKELNRVDRFADIFPEIRPSRHTMHRFNEIKVTLEQKGTPLADADITSSFHPQ